MDFEYIKLDRFHSKYHLWEDEEKQYMLTYLIEIHFIELPKFKRLTHKDLQGNPLHRWLKFLDKNTSELELRELSKMDQVIKNAEDKLEFLSSDAESIALYRAREAALHERANMINSAKAEGREEGRIEGKVEGIIEGKFEDARKMLSKNLPEDLILDITGLAPEQMAKLKAELAEESH